MNIWVLNHYADSPDRQATRSYDLGRELVSRGRQVTVFASSFSHYTLKDDKLQEREQSRVEQLNGVKFIWVRTRPYSTNNWKRVVNMLNFAWRSYRIGRKLQDKPDVVIGTSVHPLAPLAAYRLARRNHARFFYEVTDLWPETLVDMGVLSRRSPVTWALRRLEKFLFRRAERIISLLPYAYEYIERLGIPRDKIVWIPNGVDLRNFANIETYNGGNGDYFSVMYLGGHSPYHGLDVILDAAAALQKANNNQVRFVLVGDGSEKPRLMRRAQEMGLDNVEFGPVVPKQELYKEIGKADALIYTFRDLPILRFGMSPVKIFDYLASGRPILYAARGRNNPVEEAAAGVTVLPEDSEALARAIQEITDLSPEERIQMGKNGQAYVQARHDISVLGARLEEALKPTTLDTKEG